MPRPIVELLICTILCGAVVGVYAPAVEYPYLAWDDEQFVPANPLVNEGLTLEGMTRAFSEMHSANWIPLTWFSHALDVELFGLDASAHRVVNLLLHALNSCLLFLVLVRLTGDTGLWRSAAVAALFALHPAHVETVVWIAERKGLLSTTFWWLAIGAYVHHARAPSAVRLGWVGVVLAAGLLSKATLVTLPFVLLLLDFWPLRRISIGSNGSGDALRDRVDWKKGWRLAAEKAPLLALCLAASVATVWAQSSAGAIKSFELVPLAERLSNAAISFVRYLGVLVWPTDLAAFYPPLETQTLAWLGPAGAAAALLIALTAAAVWVAPRAPYVLVGWLWYLGTLVPMIGLVQVGLQSMADRYTYVPFVGLFVAIVWSAAEAARGPLARRSLAVVGVAVLATFAATSRAQLVHWSSDIALWQRSASLAPSGTSYAQLALALHKAERFDESLVASRSAVESQPESAQALHNLGAVLARRGDLREAVAVLQKAIALDPDGAASHAALGLALHALGNHRGAVDSLERALQRDAELGENPDIRLRYLEALRRQMGRREVGVAEGFADYRAALALRPGWTDLELQFVWLLATHPGASEADGSEALERARIATATTGHDSVAMKNLDTLAAAYAAAGDFEEAVRVAEAAHARAEAAQYSLVAESIRERIAVYRAGERYREEPRPH